MLESKDRVVLSDGNEYGVASTTKKNGKVYYFLVDVNEPDNFKICYEEIQEDHIDVIEINDQELIKDLFVSFNENMMNELY